jgi:hypothetical protein
LPFNPKNYSFFQEHFLFEFMGNKEDQTASKITADHDEIKGWAQERGGVPSMVKGTGEEGGGILRFDFPPTGTKPNLQEISWEEFFRIFDDKGLAFLYQEKTKEGEISRFNKFVSRECLG